MRNIFRIRAILDDSEDIIRDFEIEVNSSLNDLHNFINKSFGFSGTELDYAVEVCDDVVDILKGSSNNKIIINLPATVEMSTANIYGDQIEWMSENFQKRN